MSGDVWHVQGGPEVESLVRAAGLVVEHAGVRTALIGGLAVSCRLGMAHRATGDVAVASSAALMAMKLHAVQDRNDDRKRASDAWDLFRLIDVTSDDPAFIRDVSAAPQALLELVQRAVERVFRDEVARTRRWIRAYGATEWADRATEDALTEAADVFRAALP